MMKRFFAIITALCVLLTASYAFAALPYHTTEQEDVPYGLLFKLGIVNREEYANSETEITKGMFIRWAVRMSGAEDNLLPQQPKQIFVDVAADSEHAAEVEYAYNKGIVKGDGYGSLGAYGGLNVNDAATMAARAAGYDIDDGLLLRAKAEIMNLYDASQTVTADIAMTLLWNALDLDSVKNNLDGTHSVDKEETILEGLFNTYCVEGIVDADSMMDIYSGASDIGENKISVNGQIYDTDSDIGSGTAGMYAEVYIRKTSDSERVIYVRPVKNTINVYDESEIISYANNRILLDTNKYINVSDTAVNIENFKLRYIPISGYTIPEGSTVVTIENNGDSRVDCVFIYAPDYGKVTAVDAAQNIMYANGSSASVYDFDEYETAKLYDFDGNVITLNSVTAGSLAEIYATEDKKLLVAYVAANTAEITLSSMTETSDGLKLRSTDGAEYKLASCFGKLDGLKEIGLGVRYNALFDSKGRIAAIYQVSVSDMTYGYLYDYADTSVFGSEMKLAIYSLNDEIVEAETADKVTVIKGGSEESYDEAVLSQNFKNDFKAGLIRYQLNTGGEVSKIEYPSDDKFESGFRCVGIAGSATSGAKMYDARARKSSGKIESIGGQILFDSNKTKCLIVPNNTSNKESWGVISAATAIVSDKYYQTAKGYAVNPDSMTADVVVINEDIMKSVYADSVKTVPVLVSGFATEYDAEDGELYDTVLAYKDGAEMSYRLQKGMTAQYTTSDGAVIPVEKGDVVRLTTNHDNEVVDVKILYDESAGRAYGIYDGMYDHSDYGYGYSQRTNVGIPYKIIGNVMYMVKDGETEVSSDLFKTDVGKIYEYDADARTPIRVATANDMETLSNNPNATNKVFIMLNYQINQITVIYK